MKHGPRESSVSTNVFQSIKNQPLDRNETIGGAKNTFSEFMEAELPGFKEIYYSNFFIKFIQGLVEKVQFTRKSKVLQFMHLQDSIMLLQ